MLGTSAGGRGGCSADRCPRCCTKHSTCSCPQPCRGTSLPQRLHTASPSSLFCMCGCFKRARCIALELCRFHLAQTLTTVSMQAQSQRRLSTNLLLQHLPVTLLSTGRSSQTSSSTSTTLQPQFTPSRSPMLPPLLPRLQRSRFAPQSVIISLSSSQGLLTTQAQPQFSRFLT